MLPERQTRVLHLVAETYIDTAKAVPSSLVARHLECSSATIRSEFGVLEERGLLMQPHTSAGRIPTAAGFGRYARDLLPPRPLPDRARQRLHATVAAQHGSALLRSLAASTANLAGYAVVLEVPGDRTVRALEVHLSPLTERRVLAVAVLENGLTRDLSIDLDPTPDEKVLSDAERLVRDLAVPLTDMPRVMRERARSFGVEIRRTLHALADAWPALHPAELVSHGLSLLFDEPESNDPSFLRRVALHLEHGTLPRAMESEAPVELAYDEDVALITAPLPSSVGAGRLTLVGPTRMRYERAFSVAHGVTAQLRGPERFGGVA